MRHTPSDRRKSRRASLSEGRRRFPRVQFDFDWFVTSDGCSTLGRGIELSMRSAFLPIARAGEIDSRVVLHVALPHRPKLLRVEGVARPSEAKNGWVIRFTKISFEDASFLAKTLMDVIGLAAVPGLEREMGQHAQLDARFFRS